MRDRQLDTIRSWPNDEAVNPELASQRIAGQVSRSDAKSKKIRLGWKTKLPLINLKLRPRALQRDTVVYVWGGLILTGRFIVELDNPWSLVGFNLPAMRLYRHVIRKILLRDRCTEIRCMSKACRESLKLLFGIEVYEKAVVYYPRQRPVVCAHDIEIGDKCRFLFVATQFNIKGGKELVRAFKDVYDANPHCRLDIVSFVPTAELDLISSCPGIFVHEPRFSRSEIHERFMKNADVLVHPTYVDSFGLVALEALACGLALIVTDVYALSELVEEERNGYVLKPPISIWAGYLPSQQYESLERMPTEISRTEMTPFISSLALAMREFIEDESWRLRARQNSLKIIERLY